MSIEKLEHLCPGWLYDGGANKGANMAASKEKLDFNPRVLSGFDRWVYESIRSIQAQLKTIEDQLPNPRDWPGRDFPDRE